MSSNQTEQPPKFRFNIHDVRLRLGVAAAVGALATGLAPDGFGPLARAVMGWVGFAAVDLCLVVLGMWKADTEDIRRVSASQDLPRNLAFMLVVGAATASLGAVIGLMGSIKDLPAEQRRVHVVLSIGAVLLAWFLVHVVFTLRYAHTYYVADEDTGHDIGGLIFPDDQGRENRPLLQPNYLDFAYFSFIIGMTAQTADIGLSNRVMRRTALLHGLIAFLFNTVIVALTIGSIGGMLN